MKTILFVLTLSALIFSVLSTKTSIEKLQELSKTEFGKTLIDTIQVELKTHTEADPRPNIIALLKNIEDEILKLMQDSLTQITENRASCTSTQNHLNSDITTLDNQVKADQDAKAAVDAEIKVLENQQSNEESTVSQLTKQRDDAKSAQAASDALFRNTDARLARILAILEETKAFITARITERGTPNAFLEKHNTLLEIRKTASSLSFKRTSAGWGDLISFIAEKAQEALKQTPEDEEAKAGLQRIVGVIDSIWQSVNNERSVNQITHAQESAASTTRIQDLENQINIAQACLDSLKIQLVNKRTNSNDLDKAITNNNALIKTKTDELNSSLTSCKNADDAYSKSAADWNDQLATIREVSRIIQEDLGSVNKFLEL